MKFTTWPAHLVSPSLADIAEVGGAALANLPPQFLENIANIVIQVVDFPDEETCRELDVESPYEILGLYSGVDLARKSVLDQAAGPDVIYLYRRPILDCWCEGDDTLKDIIIHVLVHEIGHHFGLSDEAMDALQEAARLQDDKLN